MNKKVKEWLKRYVPANIVATITVLVVSWITIYFTKNYLLAAFLASIFESIVYYGVILVRDIISDVKKLSKKRNKYSFANFAKNIRNMLLEFTVAELLDTFVIRPALLYYSPRIIGNYTIGILVGKYLADIIFYVPTIMAYELRKKHLKE
jgi:hypothetical protein